MSPQIRHVKFKACKLASVILTVLCEQIYMGEIYKIYEMSNKVSYKTEVHRDLNVSFTSGGLYLKCFEASP